MSSFFTRFSWFRRLSWFRFARHPDGLRHRHWRRTAIASVACGACLAGGVALAHPPGDRGGPGGPGGRMMHDQTAAWLDGLLVEIGANDQQKATAHAARDEVFAAMRRVHESGKGESEMDAALKLFAADALDEKGIADLRQRFQAKHGEVEQVVVAAVLKIHDQLDATQRDKLIAALKDFRPETRSGFGAAIGKRMIEGRIEQALDRIKADDSQRASVHATTQRVMKAFADQTTTRQSLFDEALTLLAQPKIDAAALQKLEARHAAARVAMGDQFIQAARDVHAVLRPDQRADLVKGFSERMDHFRGR